jgi:hypothetical protein
MFPSVLISAVRRTAILCGPAVLLLAAPSPGYAQSFFETLFGTSKPAPAPNFSVPPQRLAPLGHASGSPIAATGPATRSNSASPQRSNRDDDDDDARSKGGHRTVCVRLCDGYYWPVSHGVGRSQFRKDARTCESSCNGDAKLFHLPSNGEIGDAVDQSGKPYGRLPAAFLYRKKLVAGCACRPEAWSDAEMSRHQVYAFNEAQEKARKAEAEAAEEARVAAAEAAKAEAEKRVAEAKLQGKTGVKPKKGAVVAAGPAPTIANEPTATTPALTAPAATTDDAVVGSATVASATLAPAADVAAPPNAPRKSRAKPSRDGASPVEVRAANVANAPISAPARPARVQQQNLRPQPTYAAASPPSGGTFGGMFAKKHTWPGD